jgi:hypothetical protein
MITRSIVLAGAGAVTAGLLTGPGAAQAATGFCDEGTIGYAISSPAAYGETGGTTVVIGLTAPTRTVTFRVGEDCTLEAGDRWSVESAYFRAEGTYDGTAGSLTDAVRVAVPGSDGEAGAHPVVVTLEDITGSDNDIVDSAGLFLKRRTAWRDFNAYPESPTPRCGITTGTLLHARGQLVRASWTSDAYLEDTRDTGVTDSRGWAVFAFRPPYDANYLAHYGGNSVAGHSDSTRDYVDCTR